MKAQQHGSFSLGRQAICGGASKPSAYSTNRQRRLSPGKPPGKRRAKLRYVEYQVLYKYVFEDACCFTKPGGTTRVTMSQSVALLLFKSSSDSCLFKSTQVLFILPFFLPLFGGGLTTRQIVYQCS